MSEVNFTDRELDIMSVLWANGSGTVAEVQAALDDEPGYTTVLKMLQVLEQKGHVRHESEGRAHRYHPLVAPERAGRSALRKILDKIFHGSAELLLAQLVSDRDLSEEQLERMQKLLEDRTRTGGKGGRRP